MSVMVLTSSRRLALAVGLPLALAVASMGAWTVAGVVTRTSEHHDVGFMRVGGPVTVRVSSGSITIVPGGASTVHVSYTEHYGLGRPKIATAALGGGVQFTAQCPTFWTAQDCEVDVTVTVPAATEVVADTGDGDVRASNTSGVLSLDTGNGDVRLTQVVGTIQARTGNGDVVGAGLASSDLAVETGNGDVALAWSSVPGKVRVTVGNGSVEILVPGGAHRYRVSATTGNGSRRVTVAESADAPSSIVVQTGNGDLTVQPAL